MNAVTFGVYSIGMPEATARQSRKQITEQLYLTRPSPYQDQDLADIMADIYRQTAGGQ